MKKNGFTLIELLAVIVILAVIAIISTQIVLDVISNAQKRADLGSAYGLIDAGRMYYSESLLDNNEKDNVDNYRNLWKEVVIKGEKPQNGYLYVNPKGEIALSVIYRNTCYQKKFKTGLEILLEEECGLGFVGDDTKAPDVKFSVLGNPFNENNWAKEDFYVRVEIIDENSGAKSYKWCTTQNEACNPVIEQFSGEGTILINQESVTNRICVIGADKNENKSEVICSVIYKLDKTRPSFSGIGDVVIGKDEIVNLESDVEGSDSLSGVKGTFTYTPLSVDTSKSGITEVTYKIEDNAGNIQDYIRKIMVETGAPTITFTPESGKINENGWSKEDFLVTMAPTDQSGHGIKEFKWCSTTESSCDPSGNDPQTTSTGAVMISTESTSNRICVIATDNTGTSSTNICSDTYRLDKTAPIIGTSNISIVVNGSVNLTSGVSVIDSLSGVDGTYKYSPTSVNTAVVATTNVTYTASDLAGNMSSALRQIVVSGYTWQKYNTVSTNIYSWKKYNDTINTTYDIIGTGTTFRAPNTVLSFYSDVYVNSSGVIGVTGSSVTDENWKYSSNGHSKTHPYFYNYLYGVGRYRYYDDVNAPYFLIFELLKAESKVTHAQGTTYYGIVTSINRYAFPDNNYQSDYWYVYDKVDIEYSKGTTNYGKVYSANNNTYPTNGRHIDGYWYVKV